MNAVGNGRARHSAGQTVRTADLRTHYHFIRISFITFLLHGISACLGFSLQGYVLGDLFNCILYCWTPVRTQHAVVPEDPAAALGPVHTDLQPVPPPLPHPLRPPVRRPGGSRGPERRGRAGLLPRGRLGVPPAVLGVSHLLFHLLFLLLLLFCRVQPGKKDFKSRKLPLHEPDEAQRADAPQQQQRGPEEQADSVPGRPDQHHERPLRCRQGQKPARKGGRERAPAGSDRTEKVSTLDSLG